MSQVYMMLRCSAKGMKPVDPAGLVPYIPALVFCFAEADNGGVLRCLFRALFSASSHV